MKKLILFLSILICFAAQSQSVLRAPKYAGVNSLGFIGVSKDSSGYSVINHLSVADIISLASGGSSSTDSSIYSTKAWRQKGVDSIIAVIAARNYLTTIDSSNIPNFFLKVRAGLSTVAVSGSYNDLSNKPSIPAGQVNTDWNSSSGLSQLLNKPNYLDSFNLSTRANRQKGIDSIISLNYLKTAVTSISGGWGITPSAAITSTGTHAVDSFSVTSKASRDKLKDSLQANINLKGTGNGSVTSITPGWGLTPQTAITTTGAPLVDSFSVLSKARGQKQIDSVQGNITTLSGTEKRNSISANATTTVATNTNTNLSFAVAANEVWVIIFDFTAQCSSTGGSKIQITAPTGATIEGWYLSSGAAITTLVYNRITAINTLTATAAHTVATTPTPDRIFVRVKVSSTTGNIALGFASVTATQTTTIFAGASMTAFKVTEL